MTQEYPYNLDALRRDKEMMEKKFEDQLHLILDAINARETQEKTLNKILDSLKSNNRSSPVTVTDIDDVNSLLEKAQNHAKELDDKVQQLAFHRNRITLTINTLKKAIADHPASRVAQGGKRMKKRKGTRKTKKQLPSPLPTSFGGKRRNRKTKIKLPLPLKFIGKKTRRKGRK